MLKRNQIRETKTFKKSNPIRKKMILKHKSFKEIDHGYEVAKNIGLEKWEKQTGISETRKLIVIELIKNTE